MYSGGLQHILQQQLPLQYEQLLLYQDSQDLQWLLQKFLQLQQVIQFCHWPYLVVLYCPQDYQLLLHPAYWYFKKLLLIYPEFQDLKKLLPAPSLWQPVLLFFHYHALQKLLILHPAFQDLKKLFLLHYIRQLVILFFY